MTADADQGERAGGGPLAEYTRRRDARREAVRALEQRAARISNFRLWSFLLTCGLLAAAWWSDELSGGWAAIPGVLFLGLVVRHEAIHRALARAARAVTYYEDGLARLDGSWPGRGVDGLEHASEEHPYAADLDLFGEGSLFELLCTARTRAGEEALATWLLGPATIPEITARQAAVDELRDRLDLREELALLGHDLRVVVKPARLQEWGEAPPAFTGVAQGRMRVIAWVLAIAALAATFAWALSDLGALPLLGVLALEAVCYRVVQARVEAIAAPLDGIAGQLDVLARVLERVEREPVASPWLVARVSALRDGGAASRRIAALARAIAWLEARKNALFAPFAYGLMWAWHFTLAVERWRARSGPRLRTWFTALGEFEAMAALAGYAYERPGHPFPELRADGPLLVGEALGHPLLSEESCVTNDVALGEVRALIVSGSNMSGKSTLLRTVGANVVLALAGAPVRARRLTLSPLQLAASIRVQDSLREGHSRFYAELLRLRGVVERARGEVPALFLLDEILHGTNSHDRRIGAQALVCGLVEAGAIGLVTTHDLALTRVVETLEGKARNVHFEDELVDGALRFDYRMREGVVTRSNALELMRAVGLDV